MSCLKSIGLANHISLNETRKSNCTSAANNGMSDITSPPIDQHSLVP